ncbi:MAG: DUF3078 domain-containing protein [Balneolales bacterium]
MHKLLLLTFTLFVLPDTVLAMHSVASDTAKIVIKKPNWDIDFRGGLTGSQTSYRNWSSGGSNNVTAIANTVFSGVYSKEKYRYTFNLTMRYGQTRLDDNEFRKSEDVIRFRNQIIRQFDDKRFGTVINVNFETQFDEGLNDDRDAVVSRFFAPANLTETIGFSFSPENSKFAMDAGVAMKQTFVRDTLLSERYGLDEGDSFMNEAGFSLIFKYQKELMENVVYTGHMETFTNVLKDLDSTNLTLINELSGGINNHLSAEFEFAMKFNDNISREVQIKQIFSLGVNFHFL